MILGLAVKMVMTGAVVIAVTLMVSRLGPRVGGILAGAPVIMGPAFYFLAREQAAAFVVDAAVAALHGVSSALVFLICFVSVSGRLKAAASVALAVAAWIVSALIFVHLQAGLAPALALFAAVFSIGWLVERRLRLARPRATAGMRWRELVLRGTAAGVMVGVVTTVGAGVGPTLAGTLTGFPVVFLVTSLTLHQRFGAGVARATMASAQRGTLGLIAFATVTALLVPWIGELRALGPALLASLLTSALLMGVAWFRDAADRAVR